MKTKHTDLELPYRLNGTRIEYGLFVAGDGFLIATMSRDPAHWQEKAAFVIRACNSHDKLLEACKGLLDDLWEAHQEERDTNHHGDDPKDCIYCWHMKEAEAAIALAEPKGA